MDKLTKLFIILGILCFISGFIGDLFIPFWGWTIVILTLLISTEVAYVSLLKDEDNKKGKKIDWLEYKFVSLFVGGIGGGVISGFGFIFKKVLEEINPEIFLNVLMGCLKTILVLGIIALIIFLYFCMNKQIAKKIIKKGKLK